MSEPDLLGDLVNREHDGDEPYEILDEDGAHKAARRLLWATRRKAKVIATYDAYVQEAANWRDLELVRPLRMIELAEHALKGWVRLLRRKDPRNKSWTAPGIKVSSVARGDGLEYPDKDAAIAFLKECNPDLLRVKHELDVPAVKAHIREYGEIIPGLEYVPASDDADACNVTIKVTDQAKPKADPEQPGED